MRNKIFIFALLAIVYVGGCATYESKPVPVRPASSYPLQARPQYTAVPAQPQYTAVPVQPPMTPAVPEALAALVTSYRKLGMEPLAENALKTLKTNFPDSAVE